MGRSGLRPFYRDKKRCMIDFLIWIINLGSRGNISDRDLYTYFLLLRERENP